MADIFDTISTKKDVFDEIGGDIFDRVSVPKVNVNPFDLIIPYKDQTPPDNLFKRALKQVWNGFIPNLSYNIKTESNLGKISDAVNQAKLAEREIRNKVLNNQPVKLSSLKWYAKMEQARQSQPQWLRSMFPIEGNPSLYTTALKEAEAGTRPTEPDDTPESIQEESAQYIERLKKAQDITKQQAYESSLFLKTSQADTIGEKFTDIVASVPVFLGRLWILRKMFPNMPEPMIWELNSQSEGQHAGKGAADFFMFNAIANIPAKTITGKVGRTLTESSALAGNTLISGGDWQEAVGSGLIPLAFSAKKALNAGIEKLQAIPVPPQYKGKAGIEVLNIIEKKQADAVKTINKDALAADGGKPDPDAEFVTKAKAVLNETKAEVDAAMAGSDIPKMDSQVAAVVAENITQGISKKTGLLPFLQPNGKFAILDSSNWFELATDVPANKVGSALQKLLFAETPEANPPAYRRKGKTLTIDDRQALNNALRRLSVVSKEIYKSGKADAIAEESIKINALKDKISAIRQKQIDDNASNILIRDIIQSELPKSEQSPFLASLLKAKTQTERDALIARMEGYIERRDASNAVKGLRQTFKDFSKQYGDKTGQPFAKAPDGLRQVLHQVYKNVNVDNIKEPKIEGDLTGLAGSIKGYISNLKETVDSLNLRSQETDSLFFMPESISKRLTEISGKKSLGADDVNFLAFTTKMVAKRSESAHLIKIGDVEYKLSDIRNSLVNGIRPKPLSPIIKSPIQKTTQNIKKLFGVEQMQLPTLLEEMFGKSKTTDDLMWSLWDGWRDAKGTEQTAFQIVRDYASSKGIDLSKTLESLDKSTKVKLGGREVEITRGEALSLVMTLRDPYNFDQIVKSKGFRIRDNQLSAPSMDELAKIAANLTPSEMQYGNAFFHVNNTYLGILTNKTSMSMDNIRLATDPRHFPLHREAYAKIAGHSNNLSDPIEGRSFFQQRVGGEGRIKIRDFTTELTDFVQAMGEYNGFAESLRSFRGIFNDKTLQDNLIKAGYGDELNAVVKIMNNFNNGGGRDSSVADKMVSKVLGSFAKGTLSARLSTPAVQLAAVPMARTMMDGKYFRFRDVLTEKDASDILLRSPTFWDRWYGGKINIELGDIAAQESVQRNLLLRKPTSELGLDGISYMDKRAIGVIFNAAKREGRANGLKGEALLDSAVRRAEEVVWKTQQNWAPIARSSFSSNPSTGTKMFSMFRSAQETQYNVLLRANNTYRRSQKTLADKKALAEQYGITIGSVGTTVFMRSLVKGGRLAFIGAIASSGGAYIPEEDKTLPEQIGDISSKTLNESLDMLPFGRAISGIMEAGINKVVLDKNWRFRSQDPISSILDVSTKLSVAAGEWITMLKDSAIERGIDKFGVEVEKEVLPNNIEQKIIRDIGLILKSVSLYTGAPGSAIADEWLNPISKTSKHDIVGRIRLNDADDAVGLQRRIDAFLNDYGRLESKEKDKGLTESERQQYWRLKYKKMLIDNAGELLKMRDDGKYQSRDYSLNYLDKILQN